MLRPNTLPGTIGALFPLLVSLHGNQLMPTAFALADNSVPLLECELYLADSTIPGAGIGIFSGVSKSQGDYIGNGDKAIPLVDTYWHNGYLGSNFFNPTADYVWDGTSMGMRLELFDENDVSAFWPGIDAMVNCHSGLLNVEKASPVYDEGGIHRSRHHGAGGVSPYDAGETGSYVCRDIPVGGELFKSYGDQWFLGREQLGPIPVIQNYEEAIRLMQMLANEDKSATVGIPVSEVYEMLVKPFKEIWNSRTLNAFYDFSWEEVKEAAAAGDIGIHLQGNATRSIDWLNENGKCLDHIVHKRSTVDGAGAGAFAKRDLPKGTVVTGTPLLLFPDKKWFDMYDFKYCSDGTMGRDLSKPPYGQQLLLNYCFGHPDTNGVLCPYGIGVNYINHDKTRANVEVRWGQDGVAGHFDKFLDVPLANVTDYSTKVAFDYVATRDIAEGEEIFLDYGDAWEEKWNALRDEWQTFEDRSHLDNYVSAAQFNEIHEHDYLLVPKELEAKEEYPYPNNLSLRCHHVLNDYSTTFDGSLEDFEDWSNWYGDNTGYLCEVLERSDDNLSYVVHYIIDDRDRDRAEPITISNVPREAMKFFDNPYTTDLHMLGAFRQPIGIPDDLLPDAWRKTASDEKADEVPETQNDIWCRSVESDYHSGASREEENKENGDDGIPGTTTDDDDYVYDNDNDDDDDSVQLPEPVTNRLHRRRRIQRIIRGT